MQRLNLKPRLKRKQRSGCPVSISLERFGDRWSLLVIRDLMVRGYRTFKEFQGAGEGIATNILSDRLRRLQKAGIVVAEKEDSDGRRVNYRLTEKGIDLAPVMLELLIWGARHENTEAPCGVTAEMERNREFALTEVRRRWRERDATPFLPRFDEARAGVPPEKSDSIAAKILNRRGRREYNGRRGIPGAHTNSKTNQQTN